MQFPDKGNIADLPATINFIDNSCYVIVPDNTSCYFNILDSCIVFDDTSDWGYSICPR